MAATSRTTQPQQDDRERRMERFKAIFKEHNVEFVESDWKFLDYKPDQVRERIHKPARMRVHYTCHNCSTSFGRTKICSSCQHPRCKLCVRYPAKRDKPKTTDASAPANEEREPQCSCHECQTRVEKGALECPNCQHKICEQCLKQAYLEYTHDDAPATTEPEKKPAPSEAAKPEATATAATS
jgi:hypothetical protein